LVDWKVDPGSTTMLIQKHVLHGKITFTVKSNTHLLLSIVCVCSCVQTLKLF